MKVINQIKIFISCPGDIKAELDSIRLIVEEINKTSGRQNSYLIETLNWNIDTYTQIGEDPQDVINSQLESEYDILVGLMWLRFGTPTKRDKSGTVEEINRAIKAGSKELLLYFNTAPPENINSLDLEQLSNIRNFKRELSHKGVLYKEYNSIEGFESLFRINLINLISDKVLAKSEVKDRELNHSSQSDKYSSIMDVLNKVEQRTEGAEYELDVFEVIEQLLSSLESITTSLDTMTSTLDEFTLRMQSRTSELEKINSIKDNRLRLNKTQIIVNLFANELDGFHNRISQELPRFSENFLAIGPLYSKVVQYGTTYEIPENEIVKTSLKNFRDSIEGATINSAGMLEQITKWPPMTGRFNKSKRATELVLKTLTSEMLQGLKLVDEAIDGNH
jgi:hypothetical protein